MCAGAERLPRVDHDLLDRHIAAPARVLPWRPYVHRRYLRSCHIGASRRLDQDGVVKALPSLLPVIGRLAGRDLHQRVTRCCLQVGQTRELTSGTVDRVLDHLAVKLALFDSARRELQQLGQDELGLLAVDANSETDHAG